MTLILLHCITKLRSSRCINLRIGKVITISFSNSVIKLSIIKSLIFAVLSFKSQTGLFAKIDSESNEVHTSTHKRVLP